jgi:hypothetical protein
VNNHLAGHRNRRRAVRKRAFIHEKGG